jgi:hypothetical protein
MYIMSSVICFYFLKIFWNVALHYH